MYIAITGQSLSNYPIPWIQVLSVKPEPTCHIISVHTAPHASDSLLPTFWKMGLEIFICGAPCSELISYHCECMS